MIFAALLVSSLLSPQSPEFRIVVIEGENAVNIIQQKTAVAPVVEVRDRNNLPVPGAVVTFSVTGGKTAVFAGGSQTLSVTTNAAGRAIAAAVNPLSSGAVQIQVTAAVQGQAAAAVTIAQTNVLTAAEAAAAASTGATTGGAAGSGGGGISGQTIGIVAGAGAAAAGVAVAAGGGSPTTPVNREPSVASVTASTATGLQSATSIGFTASANDPDNDPLTYNWDFGDGSNSTQANASHVFNSTGTFTVKLTVSDGKVSASNQTTVTIKNVTGRWAGIWNCTERDTVCNGGLDVQVTIDAVQSGTNVSGSSTVRYGGGPVYTCPLSGGSVSAARFVAFANNAPCPSISPTYTTQWRGTLDDSLNRTDFSFVNGSFYLIRQ